MARSRNIKPGFFKNEVLSELPALARLLYAGLWTLADRAGRLEDRPKRIKAELLAYDDCDIEALLDALANSEEQFIIRYEVGGNRYIAIPMFGMHQNPSKKEKPSTIPGPEQSGSGTEEVPCKEGAGIEQAQNLHTTSLPDSFIPYTDSPIPHTDSPTPYSDSPIPVKTAAAAAKGPGSEEQEGKNQGTDRVLADLVQTYEQNVRPITPIEAEKLLYWYDRMPADVVKLAITEAVANNARTMKYIDKILSTWHADGAMTVEAVQARQRDYETRKNQKGGKGASPASGGKSAAAQKFDRFEGRLSGMNDDELNALVQKRWGGGPREPENQEGGADGPGEGAG